MEEIPWQGGEARRYFWNRKTPSSSPLPSSGIRNTCVCQRLELSLSISLYPVARIYRNIAATRFPASIQM